MKYNQNKLVSVIIPVYNVEEYIEECILSLIKQTYSNVEIILINDGSTDSSGEICSKYCKNYRNIHLINQCNKGVSIARNTGIKQARGEYLLFIDSDDVISEVYLEKMVKSIEKNKCDMVECGYTSDLTMLDSKEFKDEIKFYDSQFIFNYMLSNREFNGYIWNKIFKKNIIIENNIWFEENILIWEDMYFVLKYLKNIKKVTFINDKLYYYRRRQDSACSELSIEKITSKLKVSKKFLQLDGENSEFKLNAYRIYINLLLDVSLNNIKNNKLSQEEINIIFTEIESIKANYKIKFKQKCKLALLIIYRFLNVNFRSKV